jgi:hypothetical protein
VQCKNKSDASNDRGNWNLHKIIQKTPEQLTGKARNQGTTENSHVGHSTRTSESTNVKVQNIKLAK